MKTTEETKAEIVAALHERIRMSKYTQKEIAEKYNISKEYLNSVLKGHDRMTIPLQRFLNYFLDGKI